MAPIVVESTSADKGPTGSLVNSCTVALPSGLTSGDVIIAVRVNDDATTPTSSTTPTPLRTTPHRPRSTTSRRQEALAVTSTSASTSRSTQGASRTR